MKITINDFRAAKNAVNADDDAKCDCSRAHRIAIETLASRCPNASIELVADMAWQVVLAAR